MTVEQDCIKICALDLGDLSMERLMDIPTSAERKRVVVVGGGFAGLNFCKRLKDERFQIVLLDKTNHHNFQPLSYPHV